MPLTLHHDAPKPKHAMDYVRSDHDIWSKEVSASPWAADGDGADVVENVWQQQPTNGGTEDLHVDGFSGNGGLDEQVALENQRGSPVEDQDDGKVEIEGMQENNDGDEEEDDDYQDDDQDDDFDDFDDFDTFNTAPTDDGVQKGIERLDMNDIETHLAMVFDGIERQAPIEAAAELSNLDVNVEGSKTNPRKLYNQFTRPTRQFVSVEHKPDPIVRWRASAVEGEVLRILRHWKEKEYSKSRTALFGWARRSASMRKTPGRNTVSQPTSGTVSPRTVSAESVSTRPSSVIIEQNAIQGIEDSFKSKVRPLSMMSVGGGSRPPPLTINKLSTPPLVPSPVFGTNANNTSPLSAVRSPTVTQAPIPPSKTPPPPRPVPATGDQSHQPALLQQAEQPEQNQQQPDTPYMHFDTLIPTPTESSTKGPSQIIVDEDDDDDWGDFEVSTSSTATTTATAATDRPLAAPAPASASTTNNPPKPPSIASHTSTTAVGGAKLGPIAPTTTQEKQNDEQTIQRIVDSLPDLSYMLK